MRPDVKLGIVISTVVVFVAGSYYLYRDKNENPIPVGADTGRLSESFPIASAPVAANQTARHSLKKIPGNKTSRNVRQPQPSSILQTPIAQRTPPKRRVEKLPLNQPAKRVANQSTSSKNRAINRQGSGKTSNLLATNQPKATRGKLSLDTKVKSNNSPAKQPLSVLSKGFNQGAGVPLTGLTTTDQDSAMETHRVQPGDTLATLAELYYGNRSYVMLLARANPRLTRPNQLPVGAVVKIPTKPTSRRGDRTVRRGRTAGQNPSHLSAMKPITRKPVSSNRRVYAVKSGDSLYLIAKRQLKDGSRWKEIFELNKTVIGQDPAHLKIGQKLILPNS